MGAACRWPLRLPDRVLGRPEGYDAADERAGRRLQLRRQAQRAVGNRQHAVLPRCSPPEPQINTPAWGCFACAGVLSWSSGSCRLRAQCRGDRAGAVWCTQLCCTQWGTQLRMCIRERLANAHPPVIAHPPHGVGGSRATTCSTARYSCPVPRRCFCPARPYIPSSGHSCEGEPLGPVSFPAIPKRFRGNESFRRAGPVGWLRPAARSVCLLVCVRGVQSRRVARAQVAADRSCWPCPGVVDHPRRAGRDAAHERGGVHRPAALAVRRT